jgi:N-acetylmuramoyl-L-alanine amidase
MKILIDNGHGVNTPGKRSPDGRLREYRYCRDIAVALCTKLLAAGYDAELIVQEETDVPLNSGKDSRVSRVNKVCKMLGASNCLLVSIHCNAAGSGSQWLEARGWSVFVAQNASANSKRLAECLADAAALQGLKIRKPLPTQKYWVKSLAMCRNTNCPAVLTENLFQDNRQDVEYLLSPAGKAAIVQLHFAGIVNYLSTK